MAVTFSDHRDYTQCFCTKQNEEQRRPGRTLRNFIGQCVIKKRKETHQHLSHSMRTCIAGHIVYRSSLDLFAPTNTTTRVSESLVAEGSRTAAIPTKQNHMWTKVSACCDTGREHVVQVNLHPATKRPRATGFKLGLLHVAHWTWNWNCEIQAVWENDVSRSSWKWPKAAVWPAVSHTQRWQWNTQKKGRTLHHSLRSLEEYFTSLSEFGGEVVARGD